ncbi:MAG TPA: MopE-related protein [Sandaracinaceae bacterium LLY-WYZ-13_1]|nr:MopE-related protein [Sandaracinaceae bacterium LLY-WYZ-13_1]
MPSSPEPTLLLSRGGRATALALLLLAAACDGGEESDAGVRDDASVPMDAQTTGDDAGPDEADAGPAGECEGASDGRECATDEEDARSICLSGACEPSRCGDGFVDEAIGEQCDDANDVDDDGCSVDCAITCVDDEGCDDGLACNGAETCNPDTGSCEPGVPAADGTACGDGGECVLGSCEDITCGNGVVNTGEDCDDGNDTAGDGCELDCTFSCTLDGDCDDGDACTVDACDPSTHVCGASPVSCDDGLDCTADACDPTDGCVHTLMDGDSDGYADAALACDDRGGDCDDADASRSPGATETCDTTDNDCDGTAGLDQAGVCECTPGDVRACYSGDPSTRGVGACEDGEQFCVTGGSWSTSCAGETLPESSEICGNDVDDDCGGAVDDFVEGCTVDVRITSFSPSSRGDLAPLVGDDAFWEYDLENTGTGRSRPFDVVVEAQQRFRSCSGGSCTTSDDWVELERIAYPDGVGPGVTLSGEIAEFVGPSFVLEDGTPLRIFTTAPGGSSFGPLGDFARRNNNQSATLEARRGVDYAVTLERPRASSGPYTRGLLFRMRFVTENLGGAQDATNATYIAYLEQTGSGTTTVLFTGTLDELLEVGGTEAVDRLVRMPSSLTPDFYRLRVVVDPALVGSPVDTIDRTNNEDEVVLEVVAP